jgi:hypothetical protein
VGPPVPPQPAAPVAVEPTRKSLPDLTVPQYLAFAAFLVVVLLAVLSLKRVSATEFHEIRKLAIFLIGALLPSDAAIRFGRSLFVKGQTAVQKAAGASDDDIGKVSEEFRATTLPQVLAFLTFLLMAALAVTGNSLVDQKGKDLIDVAAFLIGALLPSEAGIRLGRALYLRNAPNVTPAHLKKI